MSDLYGSYVSKLKKIADISNVISLLHWDKEVNLPSKGAAARTQQIATLSALSHEMFTEKSFGELLVQLKEKASELDVNQNKNVTLSLKSYEKSQKYSTEFVIRRSKVVANTYHSWLKAREANDYGLFKAALKDLIDLKREEAAIIGYEDHPYDALLDQFEPEAKTTDLITLFKDVRQQLVAFAKQIRQQQQVDNSFLKRFYDKDKQWDFGLDLLKNMGYDFEAGRQDLSPHPFTINFAPTDVRVTTRVDEQDLANMTWSCIHEGGHALYEQGLSWDEYGLPLGNACSLGIHESQARMWENNVGRSKAYWQAHYGALQEVFSEQLNDVSLDDFYKGRGKDI